MKAFLHKLATTMPFLSGRNYSVRMRAIGIAGLLFVTMLTALYIPSEELPTLAAREIYKGKYVPGTHAQLTDRGRFKEVRYQSREPDAGEIAVMTHEDEPRVTFTRWNSTADFSVKYSGINNRGRQPFRSNVMEWRGNNKTMQAYPLDPAPGMEDGGFEIEIDLDEPPASNVFTFELEGYEDFDFFYQAPLTATAGPTELCTETSCIDQVTGEVTRQRPENVVGSYAVYHKELQDRVIGKHNYGTGKFVHIYRPYIFDIDGNHTWGELQIENGVLTVTVPPEFLATATYPVTVDPTFGYTSVGASSQSLKDTVVFEYASPSADGTLDSITYYQLLAGVGTRNSTMALYEATSETNVGALIATTSQISVVNADDGVEKMATFPGTGPSITDGTNYFLAVFGSNNLGAHDIAFDDAVGNTTAFRVGATYPTFPNPPTSEVTQAVNVSIYGTYTETGGVPHLTQNDWRWYANADDEQPGSALAGQNTNITNVDAGDILRLRMNVAVATATLATGTKAFRLQYAVGPSCSTAVTWSDVAGTSSAKWPGTAWVGYNNASVGDGATTTALLLASSTVLQSYEETNPSVANLQAVPISGQGEWDWTLINTGALASTTYCFRLMTSDHQLLDAYASDGYPTVTTATSSVAMTTFRWRADNGGEGVITEFGDGGATTSNPSSSNDDGRSSFLKDGYIYAVITDRSLDDGQWRIEKRSALTGEYDATFGLGGATTTNPSTGFDQPLRIAVDDEHIYISGTDAVGTDIQWRVEKRDRETGAYVSGFGTNGVLNVDPNPTQNDESVTVVIDDNYLYLLGAEYLGVINRDWRLEKREKSTGNLVTSFGTGGVLNPVTTSGLDLPYAIKEQNGFLYLIGVDFTPGNRQWHIEKRDASSGALVTSFGTGGVIVSDKSGGSDQPFDIELTNEYMYLIGEADDITSPSTNSSIHVEKRNLLTGALCAGTSTCRDSAFDGDGVAVINVTNNDDVGWAIIQKHDDLFITGVVDNDGVSSALLIQKRNALTGAVCDSLANCPSGVFSGDGQVINDLGGLDNRLEGLMLDELHVYTFGYQSATTSSSSALYEKRYQDDGSFVVGTTSSSTWLAATNTSTTVATGTPIRLRVGLENDGTVQRDQRFRLEFAPKGMAGSCSAVSSGSYTPVPVVGSCTGSAACMATSSYVSDTNRTTPQLGISGNFNYGRIVAGTNNMSPTTTLYTNQYTEIEYVLQMTGSSAPGANYCFRVTDTGTALASYSSIAELTTEGSLFALSGTLFTDATATTPIPNAEIALVIGTTTPVVATTTTNASGEFTFSPNTNNIRTDIAIMLYVNGSSTLRAALVTKLADNSTSVTDLDFYRDHVVVRHEGATSTTLADLAVYDSTDDADIQFTASTTQNSFIVLNNQALQIESGKTLQSAASTTLTGSLDNQGTFNVEDTLTLTGNSRTLTGLNVDSDVVVTGSYSVVGAATTSSLTINAGGSLVSSATSFTVRGAFTQNGDFDNNGGELLFTTPPDFDIRYAKLNQLFNVGAQETTVAGLDFNASGTKMFIVGQAGDDVNEYDLSVPWDISTATFVDATTISAQENAPHEIEFNDTGTKMYIMGSTGDDINEYDLSTPWDASTRTYVNVYSVATEEDAPTGLAFGNGGRKLYVVGQTGDDVNEYNLSTPWDLSTRAHVTSPFSFSAVESAVHDIEVNASGTKFYITGSGGDAVFEYTMRVPWESKTAFLSKTISVGAEETVHTAVTFNNSGTKMYVLGTGGTNVYEYVHDFPIGGQLTQSDNLGNLRVENETVSFQNSASTTNLVIESNSKVNNATTTLEVAGDFTNNGDFDARRGTLVFSGTGASVSGSLVADSALYTVLISGSVTFADVASTSEIMIGTGDALVAPAELTVSGDFTNNGTYTALGGTTTFSAAPFDILGYQASTTFDLTAEPFSLANHMTFDPAGTKMYISSFDRVYQYSLTTPWDLSTRAYDGFFDAATTSITITDVAFNNDGTTLFVLRGNSGLGQRVVAHTLTTPWDVLTGTTTVNSSFSVAGQETNPANIEFNTDGSKMYIIGFTTDDIHEYSLSSAWDISTAGYADTFSVIAEDTNPITMKFSTDGKRLFMIGFETDAIYEYRLGESWDVSTAVLYDSYFEDEIVVTGPNDIAFDTTGTKLFLFDYLDDSVVVYNLSTETTVSGSLTAVSGFNNVVFDQPAGTILASSASTTNITITESAVLIGGADTIISLIGDYRNDGQFTASTSHVMFIGTSTQTATGTLSGTSQFYNLTIRNVSGDGLANQSVLFGAPVTATGTMTMSASTSVALLANATSSFATVSWLGEANSPVWLMSTASGTLANLVATGTITSTNVRDSAVCASPLTSDGGVDYGNNVCWSFQAIMNSLTLSGVLFTDAASTVEIPNAELVLVIGTSTPVLSTTTTSGAGAYSFSANAAEISTDTPILVYANGSSTLRAALVTKLADNSTSVTDLDFYRDHVVVRHEGATSTTLADLAVYDSTDDADIQFTASTTLDALTILNSQTLYIWNGTTFTAPASTTYTGGWHNDGGTYQAGARTYFTGSSTISGSVVGDSAFQSVTISGDYELVDNASTTDLTITEIGSVLAPQHLTIAGDFTQQGTFINANGTIYLSGTGDFDATVMRVTDYYEYIAEQDTATGLAFSADGTRMYIAGNTGDEINEYSLSDPFNVGTASYVDTLGIGGQETSPTGIALNASGTKLYVVGSTGDDVTEYNVVTPWDISTAVPVDTFSVAGEDLTPSDIAFSTDGGKLFIVGDTGNDINEYILTTPWDVSTGVFVDAFSVSTEENTPRGLAFSEDGMRMYVAGDAGNDINEYILSTTFDVSTAVFNTAFSIANEDATPQAVVFGNDENRKMYVLGDTDDRVYEYLLPAVHSGALMGENALGDVVVADNVQYIKSSAASDDLTIRPGATLIAPAMSYELFGDLLNQGVVDANQGQLILAGADGTLAGNLVSTSSLYDIRVTGSYRVATSVATTHLVIDPGALLSASGTVAVAGMVKNDGQFITASSTELTTVANVTSGAVFLNRTSVSAEETAPQDIAFGDDGMRMYVVGDIGDDITEYRLSSAYDVTTRVAVDTLSVASEETVPTSMALSPSGTKLYLLGTNSDFLREYNLATPWDVSSATLFQSFSVGGEEASPNGFAFKPDGTKLYVIGLGGDDVNEYSLSTPWDISTALAIDTFSVVSEETSPHDIEFNFDGTLMLMVGTGNDTIYQYRLATPWDVSTGVYVGAFSVAAEETGPTGIVFDPSGTRLYVIGSSGDEVNTYITTPSWTVVSAAQPIDTFSVSTEETGPTDIAFRPDGTMFFIVGSTGDEVNRYTLSVPWDASTATATDVFSVSSQETLASGVAFSTSGTKMFIVGPNSDSVHEYTLSTPWLPSSATFIDSLSVANKEDFATSIAFSANGSQLYVLGLDSRSVHQYSLTTPFDISTAIFVDSFTVSFRGTNQTGLAINSKGTRMYITASTDDDITEYELAIPWQVSSARYVGRYSVAPLDGAPQGLALMGDGTKLYLVGSGGVDVTELSLTPYEMSGDWTDVSALADVAVDSSATLLVTSDVDMGNLTITPDSYVTLTNTTLGLSGNYTNNGTVAAGSSTVQFLGASQQTATGTMSGVSQFYNLEILNTSANGTTSQSVVFGAPVTATGTMTMSASTSVAFLANATSTFGQVAWQGSGETSPVWLRSTVSGVPWYLTVMATKTVSYVDVADSHASSTDGGVAAANSIDSGNNINWTFFSSTPGSLLLANHDEGQVRDAFGHQNQTNQPLYAFNATPIDESTTVTNFVLTLSGVKKVDPARFSSIRLLRDVDNDAEYDVGDIVLATGELTVAGQTGAITFVDDWEATTTANYLVVGDWSAPDTNTYTRVQLLPTGVTALGETSGSPTIITGSVSSIQHIRSGSGGGGSNTPAEVGGEAPAGAGDVGGGGSGGGGAIDTNTGGGAIGNETGFRWPSANSGSWTNGANAYDQTDGTYATTNSANTHSYSNYGFGIPGTDVVAGIAVKLEVSGTTAAGTISVELSWDGGTSWTTPVKTTPTMTTLDTVRTLGGESDLWGRSSWSVSDFDAANFRVRVTGAPSSNTLQIDAIQVRVYHQATGGGGGGGGEI